MAAGVGSFEDVEEDFGEGLGDPSADVLTEAAAAFGLLASPARLHLVWALAQGESDVTALAERVGGALPAISQHLAKLKLAGLVRSRREGRRMVYLVDDPHVVAIVRLMVGQLADREAGGTGRAGGRGAARTGRLHGLGA
ncbi:metalloregulator ArsR/SmtB family transcription factor [Streptomyces sp. KLMMK]|uniref:Metalloregulator ArsR/SmtB family transcription factor n=2 Tax=Streptomyces TaxID=1883 RepID=A0A9X2RJP2_9ACTN|nr:MULTISPECIES: metalloregulator ArsR/SmtB family transcription factor [Streptomyces]MCQ8768943.1 metalloregulator ArsR/SmtB family transcription factor [Streptomyces telluris]NJP80511.1 winged helix-turn-helix transcriptional regulator [Streptomyces telluris]QLE73919.1 winged helix-turn-helix transcriptional regulator [Streptomyces rectiverticillatus]